MELESKWVTCPDCGVAFLAESEAEIKCLVCQEKEGTGKPTAEGHTPFSESLETIPLGKEKI